MKKKSKNYEMIFLANMDALKNLQNGVISDCARITSPEYPEWTSKTGKLISEEEYRDFISGLE